MKQPARDPTSSSRDVTPILERRADSIWARVNQARDEVFDALEHACEETGFDALVIKSDSFEHPAWVKLECSIPDPDRGHGVTERGWAVVTIEAREFHRYELEYRVEVDERGRRMAYPPLYDFDAEDARKLVRFILCHGRMPRFERQLRQRPYQLWRPKNRLDVLRVDWLRAAPAALVALGLLMMIFAAPLGPLCLVGAVVAFVLLRRRRPVVFCSGKPETEPRWLLAVDSWQAAVPGLGDDAKELHKKFLAVMERLSVEGVHSRVEQTWDWGLDGTVTREEIVLSLRRCLVFCQIHKHGKELYVGWEGHLNRGHWVEKLVGIGIHKKTGVYTQVNAVYPGFQRLTENDLADLNFLSECVHFTLMELVTDMMEERGINEKLNFRITRGKREGLTADEPKIGRARQPVPMFPSTI